MSVISRIGRRARRLISGAPSIVSDPNLSGQLNQLRAAATESLRHQLLASPRYREAGRLAPAGFKAYSQFAEDGLLDEVFRRVGLTNRYFVEFGVGDGLENNTAYRLTQGWRGVWLDASPPNVAAVALHFAPVIATGRLRVVESFVTAESVEGLFARSGVPAEFDLLSVDIDGNDYWVWRALVGYRPRVVIIEYNAGLGPHVAWAMPYGPANASDTHRAFGASLKALEQLGRSKGYCLVGCELSGVNAIFVRSDLVGDRFLAPFDSETHFEPPRYYMVPFPGHPPTHREVAAMLVALPDEHLSIAVSE